MTAVPSPLSVKDRPPGSRPDSARAGAGYPVARTVRLRAAPTSTLIVRIYLMAGALVTVRVNAWVAVPCLFLAVRISRYTPAAAFAGVPEIVAMPSPLSANLTPEGSRPVLVILGAGSPGRGYCEGERRPERRCGGGATGESGSLSASGGRDRDGLGAAADRNRRPRGVSGGRDRGHRAQELIAQGQVDDVGGHPVRRDRDLSWAAADRDRRARSVGGGRDRGHRGRVLVDDVGGDRARRFCRGAGPYGRRDRVRRCLRRRYRRAQRGCERDQCREHARPFQYRPPRIHCLG